MGSDLLFSGNAETFTYSYLADSNLLSSFSIPVHTTTYQYEPNRNVRTQSVTAFTQTSIGTFTYDANGNVSKVLDNGANVVSHYEYDSFGNELTGVVSDNRFQFSTKYFDEETELSYYGFRYYDAGNGRWLNRDPIGERGGVNLYAFVNNDGINSIDLFGLSLKRNCRSLSKNLSINLDSSRLGPKVGFIGLSGSQSIDLSLGGETCEECCSDGTWKEVTRGFWFIGLSGSISITGGGALTANIGWLEFDVASATVTGSISRGYSASLNCDKNGCSLESLTPSSGWQKSVTGTVCAFGTCGTKTFY